MHTLRAILQLEKKERKFFKEAGKNSRKSKKTGKGYKQAIF